MLDQNTDRMWFVIGAVIVGAAIIFIANGTIPEIFASVASTFDEQTNLVTDAIDREFEIELNLVVPENATLGIWVREDDGAEDTSSNGISWAATDYMRVRAGESYTFSAPVTMYNMRVVYFNRQMEYLDGTREYNTGALETEAPAGAYYARISGPFTYYSTQSAPVDEWWFGKTVDLPE